MTDRYKGAHTGISNLDADAATIEGLSITGQSSLETLDILELSIGETLGALSLTILNDADVHDIAALEELSNGLGSRIVRKVAEMGGERRLGRKLSRADVIADGGITCHKLQGQHRSSRQGIRRSTNRGQHRKSRRHRQRGRDAQWEGEAGCQRLDGRLAKDNKKDNGDGAAYHRYPRPHQPKSHRKLYDMSVMGLIKQHERGCHDHSARRVGALA